MLTTRFMLVLVVVTIAVTAAAGVAQYDRWADTIRTLDASPAFPEFTGHLESAQRIRFERAADNENGRFSFVLENDRWIMDSKGGYPALQPAIRELLIGLSELKLVEPKTASAALHHRLHLGDISSSGSRATRVIVENAAGSVLIDNLFGKPVPSLSGGTPSIYMRKSGDPQSWLARGELDIRGAAREWLPVRLLSVARERIERATYAAPDSDPITFTYNDTLKRFDIVDMPANRKVTSRYRLLQAAIESERLAFEDVRPAEDLRVDPALGSAVWQTRDGLTITLGLAGDPTGDGLLALVTVDVTESADDAVRQEAAEIVERTEGWAYRLPAATVDRLRTTLDSLTEIRASG